MDDRDAILRLIHSYPERLDAGDFDGVAELFARAEFGASDRAEPLRGASQVRRVYDHVLVYDGTPRTKHVLSNVVIDISGDRATSRCTFTVMQAADGFPMQAILAGRYHDTFERTSAGWIFRKRVIHVDATGDLSRHMAGSSNQSHSHGTIVSNGPANTGDIEG